MKKLEEQKRNKWYSLGLVNKRQNKKRGTSAEYYFMYSNWLFRYSGQKSFSSKGLFDCIFVGKDLNTYLVQVKSSSKPGKIPVMPKKEIFDINTWIDQNQLKGLEHLWVGYVLKPRYAEPIQVRLN